MAEESNINEGGAPAVVNHYRKNPLHVYILNAKTLEYDKAYVIINSPPPNVMRAVKSQNAGKSVLHNYFGPAWKKLLNPEFKSPYTIGGDNDKKRTNLYSAFTESPSVEPEFENGDKVVYVDYSVYPEDSIETFKNKLYVISGIAPYRQHLRINGVDTYKLIVRNNLVIPQLGNGTGKTMLLGRGVELYGVPIDKSMDLYRGSIQVISWEHETLDSFAKAEYTQVIELIDFNTLFADVLAKPTILDDLYQFDLLYYGAAISLWPQLSRESFRTAIVEPTSMTNQFPLLSPSLDILTKRFAIEKQLIDKTYEYAITPPKVYRASNRPYSAISYTYISNSESMPPGINLRNIFDLFRLDKTTCVSRLYFKPSEGPFRNVIKKHILAPEEVVKRIHEKALKLPSVLIATGDTNLTINEDQISFEQTWKEDARINYSDAISDAERRSNKIIGIINDMGVSAFPVGTKIPTGKYDKIIRSNIAAFWPRVLTTSGFAEFKRIVQYYNGSIYEIQTSGAGSIIIMFKKGMTDFDIPRLLRFYQHLKEDETVELINTFSYLTNPVALRRWQQYYAGKIVRIYHKTSEIKIESLDVTLEEFEIVKRYFFTMLDLFISKSLRGIIRLPMAQGPQYEKFLQRLREHDPELYDLRRHDKNANVYSIICQSGRQPFIYGEHDLKKLPQSKMRNLVKYWNFTENKTAYYECPYKEYPHLGFRSNEHPLGYCLPCCQKLTAIPGSKQDLINNLCLKEHQISEAAETKIEEAEGTTEEIARHAVQYGKFISAGRIGECPALISNGLFYNAVAKPYSIALIGVRQYNPATADAGFFYSLCYILNVYSDRLVEDFIEVIKHLGESYYTLGQGEANKFSGADELIAALQETLITDEQFTAFTQDVSMIPIMIDLVYIRFGISVILVIDSRSMNPSAAPDFILHTNPTTNSQLVTNKDSLELAIIFKTTIGYYPFAIVNKRMYSKYPELTRRTFKIAYSKSDGVIPVPDAVAETVIDIIKSNEEKALSLAVIKDFVAASKGKYKIVNKLIGVSDTCYGVELKTKDNKVYIPVNNSPHHVDSLPAFYGVRSEPTYTRLSLMNVIDDLNKFLKTHGFSEIIPAVDLANSAGDIVGFISEGLYYYHAAPQQHHAPEKQVQVAKKSTMPAPVLLPYNTIDIDLAIFKRHGKPAPLDSVIAEAANTELYEDYLYKLLLLEFATILQEERNEPLRKDLIQTIRKADFHDASSLSKMSETITKLLEKYPIDQKIIKTAITEREDETILFINNNVFEFDSLIIQQLRDSGINGDEIVTKLDNIMKSRVSFAETKAPILDNIFVSCQQGDSKSTLCNGKKFLITKKKYDILLDIMAQDVTNQLKNPGMFLIASGVRNPMKFIIRPDERLYIL